MEYIIDRIENNIVICENQETKQMENFNIELFPKNIKEGNVVIFKDDKFEINNSKTKDKKKYVEELMKKLMKG